MLSWALFHNERSRFNEDQGASGLLTALLRLHSPFEGIPILGYLKVKKNEIATTFLLAGDEFMPEMH